MPHPAKTFFKVLKENDVDDQILKTDFVDQKIDVLEDFGKDLGEGIVNIITKPKVPRIDNNLEIQKSAFVKPKIETPLNNVMSLESQLPTVKKKSSFFKHISFSVRGLSGATSYNSGNNSYSIITGERLGFGYKKKGEGCKNSVYATYNVGNNKTSLKYEYADRQNKSSISLWGQKDNIGVTGKFSNAKGFHSAISFDKNGAAAECGYYKKTDDYELKMCGFATTGNEKTLPCAGVFGRLAF